MATIESMISILLLLANIIVLASAECTCDPDDDEDKNRDEALKWKLGAFASILVAGFIGVCIPMLGRWFSTFKPEKDKFFVIKAFAAGVILATGFVHILPDAYEKLTSPCLKGEAWEFPWTGTVAMAVAILTLMIDTCATSYYNAQQVGDNGAIGVGDEETNLPVHTHATHGHSHGTGAALSGHQGKEVSAELIRHRVISQVLELGIIVHSVIIGISLGASESPKTIKPLVAALTFHQFFEGMGLGGCIAQAKFESLKVMIMVLFFSLTTPGGIAIGIGIMNFYDENSQTALIVEGLLNAAAAGILIYMALVDLLAADFMNPRMQTNLKLKLRSYAALVLGAGCMSLLAKWA